MKQLIQKQLVELQLMKQQQSDDITMSLFLQICNQAILFQLKKAEKKDVFKKQYGWLFDKGKHPQKTELFSMDMSKSYKAVRRENFPISEDIYDRFHIKKY